MDSKIAYNIYIYSFSKRRLRIVGKYQTINMIYKYILEICVLYFILY